MGQCKSALQMLTGKHTVQKVNSRSKWEDIINIELKKIGIDMKNWTDSAQDRDLGNPSECSTQTADLKSMIV